VKEQAVRGARASALSSDPHSLRLAFATAFASGGLLWSIGAWSAPPATFPNGQPLVPIDTGFPQNGPSGTADPGVTVPGVSGVNPSPLANISLCLDQNQVPYAMTVWFNQKNLWTQENAPTTANWPTYHIPLNAPALPPDSENEVSHPPRIPNWGVFPPATCGPLELAEHTFLWLTSPTERGGGELVFESPEFFALSPPDAKGKYTLTQNQPSVVPRFQVRSGKPRDSVVDNQVSGAVLMSQSQQQGKSGSLVFYEISVNDVYAYFRTAAATGALAANRAAGFPTNKADAAAVSDFAATHQNMAFQQEVGHTDQQALAVELKTSWVEADKVPAGCKYITRQATVPTYDTSNPHKWVVNGQQTLSLALVGMHVVGSAGGHPEMIWATFEHVCNAPNAAYSVFEATGEERSGGLYRGQFTPPTLITTPQDTRGKWLFAADNTQGPFNQPRMQMSGTSIVSAGGGDIGPSDVLRVAPWGMAGTASTSGPGANIAIMNTQTVLLNQAIFAALSPGDLRTWYHMVGAIWTADGKVPSGSNVAGMTSLANATMETNLQGQGQNCFACHKGKPGEPPGTRMSHIFASINPLPVFLATGTNSSTAAPSPTPPATTNKAGMTAAPSLAGNPFTNTAGMAAAAPSPTAPPVTNQAGMTAAPSPTTGGVPTAAGNPTPGGVAPPRDASAATALALGTLVNSQVNPAGGSTCTYQFGNTTFKRDKKGACPQSSNPPKGSTMAPSAPASNGGSSQAAPAGTAAGSGTLLSSKPNPAGGSICTYQAGNTTFTREKKGECPQTSNPPKNGAPASGAAATATEPAAGHAATYVLVGSKQEGAELVCTYTKGDKTVTHTTKKSSCPATPK
jgi:hypothetical protein